jgi:hypothetical protein
VTKRLKIIKIPRTPVSAFDKNRPASDLVKNQIRHAYRELHAWWRQIGSTTPDQIETEQQAADYLKTVTRVLHPEATPRAALQENRQGKSGVLLESHEPSSRRPVPTKRRTGRRRG